MRGKQPPEAAEQLDFFGPTQDEIRQQDEKEMRQFEADRRSWDGKLLRLQQELDTRAREGPRGLRGGGAPAGAASASSISGPRRTEQNMTYHSRQDETSEWLNYLQPEGLVVGPNVLRERGLTPIRQTPLDTEAAARALRLDPEAPPEHDRLFELA